VKISLTGVLVAVNIVAFIWQTTTRGGVDYDHGYLSPQSVLQYGEWWRIVTAAFLHANIAHIGLNMIALYSVGREVEAVFGKVRFALLYALAVLGSGLSIVYFSAYTVPTLGASGAVFGLFGALVAVGLRLGARGRSLIMSLLPVLAINLVFTFSIPGISAAAHVGGLVTGFVAGLILFMGSRRRRLATMYAYAAAPAASARTGDTIEHVPEIETIEHPPDAGPHEEAGAPPPHVRDPRE
jgi:membrane associated rhomboid family serine protease